MTDIAMEKQSLNLEKESLSMDQASLDLPPAPAYSLEDPATSHTCTFAIGKSKGWRHYYLHQDSPEGPMAFNATVHNWKAGKPTIEMRAGADETGPLVGFSALDKCHFGSRIALGDPSQVGAPAADFEKFHATSFLGFQKYDFETDELNSQRQRRRYTWVRTKHSPCTFECRDEESGAVLATFRSNGFWKWTKIGSLAITRAPSARAVQYLCLVFLTWSEVENREASTVAAIAQ